MPLLIIEHYPGSKLVFIASEQISDKAVAEIAMTGVVSGTGNPQWVKTGTDTNPERAVGVVVGAISGSVSGRPVRLMTVGIVSGVTAASSINAGDRLMVASGGRVTAYNQFTMALVSGGVSGFVGFNTALGGVSGSVVSGIAPIFTGINTGRVIGRAMTSALGSGYPIIGMFNFGG